MTAALLLGAYALLVGWVAPIGLQRDWTARFPRVAIAQWLILSSSFIAALVMAGMALADPRLVSWAPVHWGGASHLPSNHPWAVTAGLSSLGLLLAVGVLAQSLRHMISNLVEAVRRASRHAALVAAAGRADLGLGAVILDHESPTAYCVPIGCQRIVITRGAVARLAPRQLQAVVAHERAHIRAHHHLKVGAVQALRGAFPWVPLLTRAPAQVAVLAEMAADDKAARRFDPGTVAEALIVFARGIAPPLALSMGGPEALGRIHRLHRAPNAPGLSGRAVLLFGVTSLSLPVAVLLFPIAVVTCALFTG